MAKIPTTVEVNGYAGREIRQRSGLDARTVADKIDCTRAYLYQIELGHKTRVSPTVYVAWLNALGITDRRVLLADPHAETAQDHKGAA